MKTRTAVAFAAKQPLEIVDLDLEGPKAAEVLIEIMATGICHTVRLWQLRFTRISFKVWVPSQVGGTVDAHSQVARQHVLKNLGSHPLRVGLVDRSRSARNRRRRDRRTSPARHARLEEQALYPHRVGFWSSRMFVSLFHDVRTMHMCICFKDRSRLPPERFVSLPASIPRGTPNASVAPINSR